MKPETGRVGSACERASERVARSLRPETALRPVRELGARRKSGRASGNKFPRGKQCSNLEQPSDVGRRLASGAPTSREANQSGRCGELRGARPRWRCERAERARAHALSVGRARVALAAARAAASDVRALKRMRASE